MPKSTLREKRLERALHRISAIVHVRHPNDKRSRELIRVIKWAFSEDGRPPKRRPRRKVASSSEP